jgi:hypothetical protein
MRRGYYEDLRIVNENLRTSFRFPLGPLAGIFAEDFLEHFGLNQVLEGEVSKPRLPSSTSIARYSILASSATRR